MAKYSNSKASRAITGFVIGGLFGMLLAAILPGLDILFLGGSGVEPSTFASMIILGILLFGGAGMTYAVRISQERYRNSTRKFSWGALGFVIGTAIATATLKLSLVFGANLSLITFLYPWVNLIAGTLAAIIFARKTKL